MVQEDDMQKVIGLAVGLLIVVVIFYLAPGMGEEVSTALPINASGDFATAPTGAEVWTSGATLMKVVIIVVFIGVAIGALFKLKKQE
jgi:uncharacterized membrane protein